MRGQAFVVFREIPSATAAMRNLQGFPFYDRDLKIEYAKTKSKAIKMREGSYTMAPRPAGLSSLGAGAQKRALNVDSDDDDDDEHAGGPPRKVPHIAAGGTGPVVEMEVEPTPTATSDATNNPPNHILFIRNLPSDLPPEKVPPLFTQYPGYKEIRLIPGNPEIAFVEYETDAQAEVAKNGLDGFKVSSTHAMVVEFAKRG
ncbi:U2 small nuclear ribonucleoprotein B'' [Rhizophlyctis rosea]|nr:U2 small nuclear ribonucleoprotein B'' [Rhizophlyctis rosea]